MLVGEDGVTASVDSGDTRRACGGSGDVTESGVGQYVAVSVDEDTKLMVEEVSKVSSA